MQQHKNSELYNKRLSKYTFLRDTLLIFKEKFVHLEVKRLMT